jgi:hypothetical protein
MTHAIRQQTWASHMLVTNIRKTHPQGTPFFNQATLAMVTAVLQGTAFGMPR